MRHAIWQRMVDTERTSPFFGSLTSRRAAALDSGMEERAETRMRFPHQRSAKRSVFHRLARQCVTYPGQRESALARPTCGTMTRSTSSATHSNTAGVLAMPTDFKRESGAKEPAFRQRAFRSASNPLIKGHVEAMNQGGTMMTSWALAETLPTEDAEGIKIVS